MSATLTDAQKQVLKEAAYGAVRLVSNADPGFFALLRESYAASAALLGGTGLVGEALTTGEPPSPARLPAAEEAAAVRSLLRQAVEILAVGAPDELPGYREVVLDAVHRVAAAAGGVKQPEADAIAQVATALGVPDRV